MGSRGIAGSNSRSHARPKGGLRARSAALALGVITVTAGVGVTLAMGGGLISALLVYTLGASTLAPLLAVAPHARGALSTVRHRAAGPRLSRQLS